MTADEALAAAKEEIEHAVTVAAVRLRERTGLVVAVEVQTLDVSTYARQGRVYVAKITTAT